MQRAVLSLVLLMACSGGSEPSLPVTCGDGALDEGEQCDDGNAVPGDGCGSTCRFEPVGLSCGDGTVDPGEVCDDANLANGDACNPTCNFENTTSLFVGSPGLPGLIDDVGGGALIGGSGALAADATNLWLTDGLNRVVRRIEIATADVVTVAGDPLGGPGSVLDDPVGINARFSNPEAITTDGNTIWIADSGRIRAVSAAAPHAVTTVAGQAPGTFQTGNGAAARFDSLRGLAYYAGKVYFVDANAGVLGSFDPLTGDVVALAGNPYVRHCPPGAVPVDGNGAAASFCSPRYVTSDDSGTLYVADTNGNSIRTFDTVTTAVAYYAGTGTCGYADGTGSAAQIDRPRGMTHDGTSLYFVEADAHTIRQGVLATGEVTTMVGTPAACKLTCSCSPAPVGSYLEGIGAAALLDTPFSIAYHVPSRSLFFVDAGNAVIRRIR